MQKNKGLVVKGRTLKITRAKYDKPLKECSSSKMTQPNRNLQPQKKHWVPAFRDQRSYKQVVQESKVEVVVPTDDKLEKSLKGAYICYFKDNVDMKKSL